jgi:hypothetical protein
VAAYTVQKLGKRAVLVEPGGRLGGLSSGGLGYTDIGNKYAITGIARDFYRRVGRHYGKFEQWIFEPKVAESIFQDYVREGGFPVVYQTRVREVRKQGNRITEVVMENSRDPKAAPIIVRARMFIDCGYEGDLMARAGISYATGREDNRQYNETINGVQVMDGHQFPDAIDPYKTPGKPNSGLLWGISSDKLLPNGTGDQKIQAYNYRICLTSDPANRIEITKPEGYDAEQYALLLRLFDAYPDKRKLNNYFIWSNMPNHKTDINNRGPFSTDMIGMNYRYPEGSYEEREKIIQAHTAYTKGLLYFFGHDARVPPGLRNEMQQWGYPKDEYVDTGNWTPQLYIREARRLKGDYVMTQHNCEGREVVTDGVGMAAYTMDSHNAQRIVVNGQVKNEGNVEVGGFGPYPISYRSLTPRAAECGNLLVPVCLSATHIAFGSIRMEPVFMVLGQSSATAAVMAIDAGTPVQRIDVTALQARLKNDPLADGTVFEILADNADTRHIERKGTWAGEQQGGYGPDYLVHQPGKESTAFVRFTPVIPESGTYEGYIYFPKVQDVSEQTMIIVYDGERVPLGTYKLPSGKRSYVQVSSKDANGKVVADAVIWVPADRN